jgi:regulatory protein
VRITRIEPQQRKPGRRNIYADGKFLIGVSAETLLRSGLRTGDEVAESEVRKLVAAEELAQARAAAMRLLARRPRTEKEIRDRLRTQEIGDDLITRVVEELRNARLLNDEEFARTYVRDVLTLRPSGRILLRRKLLLLGVDKELVNVVLEETLEGTDQTATAIKLARGFLKKSTRPLTPEKQRSRIAAFLGRRGYSWDIIQQALRNLTGEDEQSSL